MPIYKRFDRLPAEYQEVEYIESTGTQWIDSGVVASRSLIYELSLRITATGAVIGIMGAGDWAGSFYVNGSYAFEMTLASRYVSWDNVNTSERIHVIFDNANPRINDEAPTRITSFSSAYSGNVTMFKIGKYNIKASALLYFCKIYDSGNLIRNFVPCYRKSDNVIGLYDLVNGVFYVNRGTGEFLKGPNVYPTPKIATIYKGNVKIGKVYKGNTLIYSSNALPSAYQKVEYIESTGTQYIDTQVFPNHGHTYGALIDFQATLAQHENCVFGVYTGSNTQLRWRAGYYSGGYSGIGFTFSELYPNRTTATSSNQSFSIQNNVTMSVFLFAQNENGQITHINTSKDKLYSCQISQDDVLVRNFIPCYRKSDNVIGLYDLVTKTFFTNQGTGTFLKGPDVNQKRSNRPS